MTKTICGFSPAHSLLSALRSPTPQPHSPIPPPSQRKFEFGGEFGGKLKNETERCFGIGILRTYMTRHGQGPFVSEDSSNSSDSPDNPGGVGLRVICQEKHNDDNPTQVTLMNNPDNSDNPDSPLLGLLDCLS